MVRTPWGDAGSLRDRRLPPGPGLPRAEKRRNQRERLLGAIVVSCETRGYEATSVAHLLELSGVSRATFYEHFDDKVDCLRAAVEEIFHGTIAMVRHRLGGAGTAEERARAGLETFARAIVAQPAAARMCMVESYAAGEPVVAPVREAIDEFGRLIGEALRQMPEREELPAELVRSVVGGFYRVFYNRLQGRREVELPGLVPALGDWALSYLPPPRPLRRNARRTVASGSSAPPFAAHDPEQRILRAFAAAVVANGYGATTLSDIAAAGSISLSTFYEHFADKADAMDAALDSSGAQMLAAVLPRAARASDWPGAMRVALGASCGFLAAEPAFARLRAIEVYAAGRAAIARRDEAGMRLFEALLDPDVTDAPEVEPIALEAIVGAIYGSFYDTIRAEGTDALPALAPLLTYLALAPFLGAEEACAVATG
jgi:AcrR family transcriptional regulator